MSDSNLYPWHTSQWNYLLQRWQQQKLPHALLLSGHAGLGKKTFSEILSQFLLCEDKGKKTQACGSCRGCQMFNAGSHPDFYKLIPENDSKIIRVDQVRELINQLSQTSQQQQFKIALLMPAEGLNVAASNALLKTLEEPTANTVIILLAQNSSAVSATIRSRCQSIVFHTPDFATAEQWLADRVQLPTEKVKLLLRLSENAPLQALRFSEDEKLLIQLQTFVTSLTDLQSANCVKMASELMKFDLLNIVTWWSLIINDLLRLRFNQPALILPNFVNSYEKINRLASKINFYKLFQLLDRLYTLNKQLQTTFNLNQQLLLEDLLMEWFEAF